MKIKEKIKIELKNDQLEGAAIDMCYMISQTPSIQVSVSDLVKLKQSFMALLESEYEENEEDEEE